MKTVIFSSALALGLRLMACNNDDQNNRSDAVDSAKTANLQAKTVKPNARDFAVSVANGGMMEVELGQIVQEKCSQFPRKSFWGHDG